MQKLKRNFLLQRSICFICLVLLFFNNVTAQIPSVLRNRPGGISGNQNSGNSNKKSKGDSLTFQHRDDAADSITISYRYLDSLTSDHIDSTIDNFNRFYSVPADYITLGNNGTAAYPILFTPLLKAGWDAGFHAFDLYKYTIENTQFYRTTKPFTQLTYLLASAKEQVIGVTHTQNIKPNWNVGLNYRLISSPGFFQTQNSNINNYRFFSNYQGKRKRYAATFVLLGNKIKTSENGGIQNDSSLYNPDLSKRFNIPVKLGGDVEESFNVFSTSVTTGNFYTNFTALFRQSYDFGIKDSLIINDSTTEYLFYPKFRFQHTLNYSTSTYKFKDTLGIEIYAMADAALLNQWYNLNLSGYPSLNFYVQDKWKNVSNDFAIRQFPETKNPGQFIEVGARIENFTGTFLSSPRPLYPIQIFALPTTEEKSFYNIVLHGDYRNKTRNRKWDATLKGEFYGTGFNAGDYSAYVSLARVLNANLGNVQVSFQNVNRTPSYIFNSNSAFNLDSSTENKKENITVLAVSAVNKRFALTARNISITNYAYYKDYYHSDQFNGLVNITQVTASTKNKIVGHLNLISDFIIQQTSGNDPVRVPLFFTRQRVAFEGNFFKNLFLSTGLDVEYNTPYKPYNYSPVLGKFFPQDSVTISNPPKIDAYFDFRIRTFTGLVKIENLNTVNFANGFGFTNNNFAAPGYPTPGFIFRIGVQWNFIN